MTALLNKAASTFAGIALFCVGCVMAGLGLSVVALLAVFAMATVGLAILASPFVALAQSVNRREDIDQETAEVA